MVFTSHVFLFYFLPLVLGVYYLLPFRARTALIAVSSYVFYGWANPVWAAIMFFGSSVDYICGIGLLKLSGLPDEPGGLQKRQTAFGPGDEELGDRFGVGGIGIAKDPDRQDARIGI